MNQALCKLHKEFDKHSFVDIGRFKDEGYEVDVLYCTCGIFLCTEDRGVGDEEREVVAGLARKKFQGKWAPLLAEWRPAVRNDWAAWCKLARLKRFDYARMAAYLRKVAGIKDLDD